MPEALIRVDGVSKAFRIPSVRRDTVREHVFGLFEPRRFERLQVLDDVSFELRQGETLGIMGRNGSGKSTLLKIICGIYPPDAGRVDVRATVTPDSRARRRLEPGARRDRQRVSDRHR